MDAKGIIKNMKKQTLKKGDDIKINITHEGAPIIQDGYVKEISKNMVALEIDLRSKYCEVGGVFGGIDGECGLYIVANERSISLNEKVERDEPTLIELSDFVGWGVFAFGISRYTLNLCLYKP